MNELTRICSIHTDWVTASEQLRAAYRRWCEAPHGARSDCYAAVVAMFDQEEAAALAYSRATAAMSGVAGS